MPYKFYRRQVEGAPYLGTVVELRYTSDLKSDAFEIEGSNPSMPTNHKRYFIIFALVEILFIVFLIFIVDA